MMTPPHCPHQIVLTRADAAAGRQGVRGQARGQGQHPGPVLAPGDCGAAGREQRKSARLAQRQSTWAVMAATELVAPLSRPIQLQRVVCLCVYL